MTDRCTAGARSGQASRAQVNITAEYVEQFRRELAQDRASTDKVALARTTGRRARRSSSLTKASGQAKREVCTKARNKISADSLG